MKIYGFPTENNGCGKYRLWNPLAAIARQGLAEVDREPDAPRPISIERIDEIFKQHDLIFCQPFNEIFPACIMMAARDEHKKKLVVDLDDNIWSLHPMNLGPVKGKLTFLQTYFDGPFQDFWELIPVSKMEARQYKDRVDGTLVKNEKGEINFLHNKRPHVRLAVEFMIQNADAVTTTNEVLAEVIRRHTEKPVYVLPNCLDLSEWRKITLDGPVCIGWCGSVSHYPDLKQILPGMDKLMERHPEIGMQIMGASFDYLFPPKKDSNLLPVAGYGLDSMWYTDFKDTGQRWPGRMQFNKPVPIQEFNEWICSNWCSDIGIAPLDRNDFNDAKSELKWLEYTAIGIPTIASNFGPYKRAIRHNEDGILVDIPDFWFPALNELVLDAQKREKLVKNATERLHADYDIDKKANNWMEVFDCVYSSQAEPVSLEAT